MNCKPGDLAIVFFSQRSPELIGAIVEIVRRAFNGDEFSSIEGRRFRASGIPDGISWRIKLSSPLRVSAPDGTSHYFAEVSMLDTRLRPVSGLPIDEEVIHEVTA
ncbi:hypothetical protein [Robbsia andropogonis]|uniref:hypothetical protein n=1 Tax=Robbsia andropogonis TaxID=28092 RepID=UPI0020A164F9|nr:hypothetical protein [Robbsia andropogonis]MCP1121587.1 hypothetical protein [Robbsia andropogonis]MCP1131405.1 hypothetical protein [Robbsia andropogonis]